MKRILLLIIYTVYTFTALAQSGNWVWLKGEDTANSLGNYGIMGVPSSTNEPPARYQAAYWTDLKGNFWIFGGAPRCNDLWKYSPISNEWTWIKGPMLNTNVSGEYGTMGVPSVLSNPPALGYGANCWTDPSGDLWLFAGENSSGGNSNDVLWRYHIVTNEWTWMKGDNTGSTSTTYGPKGVAGNTYTPGPRVECKSAWVFDNKLWLFGGLHPYGTAYKNDLWSYNIGTNNWAWESGTKLINDTGNYGVKGIEAVTNIPPSRASYTRWQDRENNFYLFAGGGVAIIGGFNDVWKYNHSSKLWTWISGTNRIDDTGTSNPYCDPDNSHIPASRIENQTAQTNSACIKAFWSFGGFTSRLFSRNFNDLWLFNIENFEWTKVKGSFGTPPSYSYGTKGIISGVNMISARGGSCVWTDKAGVLYVFGGSDGSRDTLKLGYLNDLWKFVPDTTCFKTGLVNTVKLNPPSDTLLCEGDTIKMGLPLNCTVYVLPSTGSKLNTSTNQVEFFGLGTINYTLIAAPLDPDDPCFKKDTISFTIKGLPKSTPDFNINPSYAYINNPTFNFLNKSTNAVRYEWYYKDKLISTDVDIVYNFYSIGEHCVTLVSINDCGKRDSVTKCCNVYVKGKLVMPNAFTPNGDNKNDKFRAILSSPVQAYNLLIMNRYGQEIFKTEDPKIGWDGTFNGQDQEVGVYYYLVKVKFDYPDAVEEMYKGDISLLR